MKTTAAEREKDFREDLESLLARHGAELELIDVGNGYSRSRVIGISMYAKWDDGDMTHEYCEFEL